MPYSDESKARESNKLRQRRFRERHPEAQRGYTLKYRYGISLEQYNEMLKAQDGKCAICRQDCRTGMNLAVDHDEETGQVRGLLCRACNGGIGAMGYSVENLERATDYLRSAKL